MNHETKAVPNGFVFMHNWVNYYNYSWWFFSNPFEKNCDRQIGSWNPKLRGRNFSRYEWNHSFIWLGGFKPFEKYARPIGSWNPRFGVNIKTSLKPSPSYPFFYSIMARDRAKMCWNHQDSPIQGRFEKGTRQFGVTNSWENTPYWQTCGDL